MSAPIVPIKPCADTTAAGLEQFFSELNMGGYHRIAITCGQRDDLTHAFLMLANGLARRHRPVALVCADAVAVARYRAAIAADAARIEPEFDALDEGRVTTAMQIALNVFSDERVCRATRRQGRVLDGNEMDVLMEDIKVSGVKPGRLREMLKFFYKSMADCSAEEDGWLETGEEKKVFSILEENLEARRAMLPAEVFGLAYRGMMDGDVGRRPQLVLCDDWSGLSKSAQRFIELMATEGLVVAGSTCGVSSADEPYPNPEGFAAFARRPNMSKVTIEGASTLPQVQWSCERTPVAEAKAVAERVKQLIAEGMAPEHILLAVPNGTWCSGVSSQLEVAGVKTCVDREAGKVKGDPRYPESAASIKAAALDKLRVNPADMTALRTVMGAGDWLLRSDAFLGVLAYAREQELTVPQAIKRLRSQDVDNRDIDIFRKFDAPLDELDALGIPAVEALCKQGQSVPPAPTSAAAPASQAYQAGCVTVAPYNRCRGHRADAVFVMGVVNGLLPAADAIDDGKFTIDHRRSALARESSLFSMLCGMSTSGTVFVSRFECDDYKSATLQNVQVARVFAQGDARWARVEPSVFAPDGTPLPDVVANSAIPATQKVADSVQ